MNRLIKYPTFDLKPTFLDWAWDQAGKMRVFNGSHRKRKGNFVGLIGEKIALHWLSVNGMIVSADNLIEHDLSVGKTRIEIKTKERTVDPLPYYEATVPKYVYDKQQPDHYLFLSLTRSRNTSGKWHRSFKCGYIVGFLPRTKFDKVKYLEKAGYKSNGAQFFCDAWNCRISDLIEPEKLLKILG